METHRNRSQLSRASIGIHGLMVHCSSIVLHKLLHEFVAFKTIFGWAPRSSKKRPLHGDAAKSYSGDPELACKVLCDFNSKFPDGEKDLKKKPTGRNRGFLDLTEYSHAKGARMSNQVSYSDVMLDKEAFLVAMDRVRKWKTEKALLFWNSGSCFA